MPKQSNPARRRLVTALGLGAVFPFPAHPMTRSIPMTATPAADDTILVNIFTVAPEKRDALVDLLEEGTADWISKVPGFISATLHAARDGRRVVIVGRWTSEAAVDAMRQHAAMPAYFERVQRLATMDVMTCDVVSVTSAPKSAAVG